MRQWLVLVEWRNLTSGPWKEVNDSREARSRVAHLAEVGEKFRHEEV